MIDAKKKTLAAALCGLIVLSSTTHVRAADPLPTSELTTEAKEQYKSGLEALTQKRFVEAALHFEAATSRTPHAVSWYMASTAWEQASRPERAADALTRALETPGLSDDLAGKIRARVEVLESTLGTLVLTGPEGYHVTLDAGVSVPLPARLHGIPGAHSMVVEPSDRASFRRDVVLHAGQVLPQDLTAEDPPKPRDDQSSPPRIDIVERIKEVPRPIEPRKYVGFAALGFGGATLLASAVLGASALDARDSYEVTRTQGDYDHVRQLQTWTNVAIVTGAVFGAAGIALVLWPEKNADPADPNAPKTSRLTITPAFGGSGIGQGSMILRGAF